jgi:AraC family transcriptional regulator
MDTCRDISVPSSSRRPARPAVADAPDYQGGELLSCREGAWNGVNAHLVEICCDEQLHVDLGSDCPVLSVVLEEVGGPFVVQSKAWHGSTPAPKVPQPLSLIPPGLKAFGKADGLRFIRHLILRLDCTTLSDMIEDEIDLTGVFRPRLMFSSLAIMRLAQLFAGACVDDGAHPALYGDSLAVALVLALAALDDAPVESIKRAGLAPWQVRRVTDYLAAHLTDNVRIKTLSDLAELSPWHFSRAFKSSTGLAPHQWLIRARLAKATQLMLGTEHPLAQIAADVGFSDQSHFSRAFRRATGDRPQAWRRARCG